MRASSAQWSVVRRCAVLLNRGSHKIVIPMSPDAGNATHERVRDARQLPRNVSEFMDRSSSAAFERQRQLVSVREATDAATEQLWRDSKPHLRKQAKLVEELGVEGAVRETLQPTTVSFAAQLKQRPLDRAILEEIYVGLHGRRIERKLKKGVSWEHWIAKGEGTSPIFTTSANAQQTFAFGGHIRLVGSAAHPSLFPNVPVKGTAPVARSPSRKAGSHGTDARETLLPEVAFIGRTSSGKSSLVNAIVNAMVSPYGHLRGTTREVRFYNVANRLMLVDCPGYGYYNPVSCTSMDAENAVRTMRAYLQSGSTRQHKAHREASSDDAHDSGDGNHRAKPPHGRNIKRVFLCVPARGLQHTDVEYCNLLEELGIPFTVVLTKTDAAPIRFLARLTDHIRCQLLQYKQCKELMLTSSLRIAGIDKMQELISSMSAKPDALHGATTDFSSIV